MAKTHPPYAPGYWRRMVVERVPSGRTPGELARALEGLFASQAASSTVDSVRGGGAHASSVASRSRSDCCAAAASSGLPAFRASSSDASMSFRASSLRPRSAFAIPRLP